jgi:hypothetical protein
MNFSPRVQNNTEQLKREILEDRDQFESWQERVAKKTMAEVWKKLGITDTKESEGQHAMVSIGDHKKNMNARNPISGLNALADIPKYRTLEWHKHIAWFDPTLDANDVVVYFNEATGKYEFYSWLNGVFQSSILNMPTLTSKNLLNKRRNIVQKHAELDRYCQAKDFKNNYRVIMADDNVKHHYQDEIRKWFESPYSVYLEEQIKRWNEVQAVQKINYPSDRYVPAKPPSTEKVSLVEQLNTASKDVVLKIQTLSSPDPRFEWFRVNDDSSKNRIISGILKSNAGITVAMATQEEIDGARIILG